jgi:hypothetical protein
MNTFYWDDLTGDIIKDLPKPPYCVTEIKTKKSFSRFINSYNYFIKEGANQIEAIEQALGVE